MKTLFSSDHSAAPLAERLRPSDFSQYVGQDQLVGRHSVLRRALEQDDIPSMILWGPPGCGKTTLAHIIAQKTGADFRQLSAVSSGKKDLQVVIADAKANHEFYSKKTILFIDEIHRWNKAQQDALLPVVEDGTITLIGASTENPSFEVISALLSRCQVFVLDQLSEEALLAILREGVAQLAVECDDDVLEYIAGLANGDARTALNTLEFAATSGQPITTALIKDTIAKTLVYDKSGEEHYNIISALHKTMRAGDANAAVYWLGRMLEAGENPLYVARRVVRFASEDVGNAKPTGLALAVAAYQACHFLGMPECNLALAQAVEYLALAPKSRRLDTAYAAVRQDIQNYPNEPVPLHLRNAPTKLMKELGYGKRTQESNLPKNLADRRYLD